MIFLGFIICSCLVLALTCRCVSTQTPFARDSVLKDEVVDKLNEALTCVCLPALI